MKLIPIIDNVIAELDANTRRQQTDIQRKQKAKHYLRLARNVLAEPSVRSGNRSNPTISDRVQQMLSEGGSFELPLDEIFRRLQVNGVKITRKNLQNTLNRVVSRKKRFKRTSTNMYALLEGEQ